MKPKEWIAQTAPMFEQLKGKPVCVFIDDMALTDSATYQCIRPTRLSDLGTMLKDEKKLNDAGKMVSPACFDIVFEQGVVFTFVRDATTITQTVKGLLLCIGETTVRLEVYS